MQLLWVFASIPLFTSAVPMVPVAPAESAAPAALALPDPTNRNATASPLDGFGYTCEDFDILQNMEFTASCRREDGSYVRSTIQLGRCFENVDGVVNVSAPACY